MPETFRLRSRIAKLRLNLGHRILVGEDVLCEVDAYRSNEVCITSPIRGHHPPPS